MNKIYILVGSDHLKCNNETIPNFLCNTRLRRPEIAKLQAGLKMVWGTHFWNVIDAVSKLKHGPNILLYVNVPNNFEESNVEIRDDIESQAA